MIRKVRYRYVSPLHLIDFGAAAALFFVFVVQTRAVEPMPDSEDLEISTDAELAQFNNVDSDLDVELPTDDGGFYPTLDETLLLGGDYARSFGGPDNSPPDARMQTAQGIYPYPNPGQGYRAPWAESLSPLNPFLGFFAPRQGLIAQDEGWPRGLSLDLDSSFPILVRDFAPEKAMLKAGPTYFDLLFVGTTVIHSDYQGRSFANGSEDGWLMGIEFGLRGVVQFTDQFYLGLAATLVYLPFENEIGIRLESGGIPTAIAELNYAFEHGTWDIRLYDNVYAGIGNDLFAGLGSGARDQAGRYSFGFNDRRNATSGYYNGDNAFFTNTIGFDASTPAWDDWRFWVSGKHRDIWRTWDFDDHVARNSLYSSLGYNGSVLMFAPSLEYYLDHTDTSNSWRVDQRLYLAFNGRLSENITLEARGGYLWQDGSRFNSEDGYLYSLTLLQELSRYASHSLSAGRDYFEHDLTGSATVADYIRYTIDYTLSRSLSGRTSVQYSDEDGSSYVGHRTTVTSILRYALFNGDRSAILLRGAYENRDGTRQNGTKRSGDHWLGRVSYTQQLYSRTKGEIFYQYEEDSTAPKFNEQLFGFTLRQYF